LTTSKEIKKAISDIVEFYPDGYRVDWHNYKIEQPINLPIDILFKLYPITTTWSLRQKHHSNPEEEAESS
jgi:hypothetical protein